MRIFKYWALVKGTCVYGRESIEVHCYGGSNASQFEAERIAKEKVTLIQQKIDGQLPNLENYQSKSTTYAVCKFIKDIGKVEKNSIINLHDEFAISKNADLLA